ncbi:hypothetical protein CR513_18757, partial [Mucuna pruriens]
MATKLTTMRSGYRDIRDSSLVCEVALKSIKLGVLKVTNDLMEGNKIHVLDVIELWMLIPQRRLSSGLSVQLGAARTYQNLREMFRLSGLKKELSVIMAKDKVVILGNKKLPNLSLDEKKRITTKQSELTRITPKDICLAMLNEHFFWPHMRENVHNVCEKYLTCNVAKSKVSPYQLYTVLPIHTTPWVDIPKDFVLGLPRSKRGRDSILWWLIGSQDGSLHPLL